MTRHIDPQWEIDAHMRTLRLLEKIAENTDRIANLLQQFIEDRERERGDAEEGINR